MHAGRKGVREREREGCVYQQVGEEDGHQNDKYDPQDVGDRREGNSIGFAILSEEWHIVKLSSGHCHCSENCKARVCK